MAEQSYFWDGLATGDATLAPYNAGTAFSEFVMEMTGQGQLVNKGGVLRNELNSLAPVSAAPNVTIDTGKAGVYGDYYKNTVILNVFIPTPIASTRVDSIVLRKDWILQTVRVTRIAGVEGGSAPALVQTPGVQWDVPICTASITTGGAITVTDTRVYVAGISSAYGKATTSQTINTTSTPGTAVTGLSVPFVADGVHDVKLTLSIPDASLATGTEQTVVFALLKDTVIIALFENSMGTAALQQRSFAGTYIDPVPAPGSHTYSVNGWTSSGSLLTMHDLPNQNLLYVEDRQN